MLALDNATPFPAVLVPGLDRDGFSTITVVIKATYVLPAGPAGGEPFLAPEQEPIRAADEHHGDPATAPLRYESDLCPQKAGTDVVLLGDVPPVSLQVSSRSREARSVHLLAGPLVKTASVRGDEGLGEVFGFVRRDAEVRRRFAGTYDRRWREERCPMLPLDFDDRFHNAAPPDQVVTPHLLGGERVRVIGAAADELSFHLPAAAIEVTMTVRGDEAHGRPALDTVRIEPGAHRLVLTHRWTRRCPRTFLTIDRVAVRMEGP